MHMPLLQLHSPIPITDGQGVLHFSPTNTKACKFICRNVDAVPVAVAAVAAIHAKTIAVAITVAITNAVNCNVITRPCHQSELGVHYHVTGVPSV